MVRLSWRFHLPIVAMTMIVAASAARAQQSPGEQLKDGESACFGATVAPAELARLPKGAISQAMIEIRREGDIRWGAVLVRLKGDRKTAFVKDGCEKQSDGSLRCSVACDGGFFSLAARENGVTLTVGDDGLRVRTCGSSLKQLGTAVLKPADIRLVANLEPRPARECRTPMRRFEVLLQKEEAAID